MVSKLIVIEENQIALTYFGSKLTNLITEHKIYNINDIYLGKISSVLPSLEAAFITLNPAAKNGFMHLGDVRHSKKQVFTSNLKRNDTVLVQITKEPTGTKGPTVTGDINLIGKSCAILPFSEGISIPRKLENDTDKDYLRAIGCILKPDGMGIAIRSKCIKTTTKHLLKEIQILKHRWFQIIKKSKEKTAPCLLSNKKSFIIKVLGILHKGRFDHIVIDSYEGATKIKRIIAKLYKLQNKPVIINFYKNSYTLLNHHCLDLVVAQIIQPRVDLLQGGHIVIEKTEALTTIDVNSGSFTHLSNPRETILWTNYAAAYEILRQIKLRNIGGIIIIDFIDSSNQEDQMKILLYLHKLMKHDNVSSTIIQISELGLVEITRTRQGQNVYDAFSRKCNVCNGLGYNVKKLQPNSIKKYELLIELLPDLSKK